VGVYVSEVVAEKISLSLQNEVVIPTNVADPPYPTEDETMT